MKQEIIGAFLEASATLLQRTTRLLTGNRYRLCAPRCSGDRAGKSGYNPQAGDKQSGQL